MATAKTPKPKLVQMGISYSVGIKVNLGDFNNADFRLSRDEQWDVSALTPDQAKALWNERYASMKHELSAAIEAEHDEVLGLNAPQIERESQ